MAKTKEQAQQPEQENVDQVDTPEVEIEETEKPDYEALYNECKGAAEELAESKDKYIRLLAEYDNYRKRSLKDKEAVYTDVKVNTIAQLLPVYDNLERALAQETTDEAYKKGVEMTMTQFKDIMSKMDVTEYGAVGDSFDPEMHSGVMHVEDENFAENTIAEVFQKGFRLKDKVIRFAMVKVAN